MVDADATSPLCSARAETFETALERELFRLSRLLDGVCSRLLDVERRLAQTEETQQAQAAAIEDARAALKKVPSDRWMREAEARQEEAAQSCLHVQEQVHALVDFLAEEHIRQQPQGPRDKEISHERSEMMDGDGLTSRAVQQLAQRAEDPLLSERLRRIFCPPSRGNSVDSPPREDFASVGARGEDPCRVTKAVKVAPPTVADTDVATPPGTQASELRMGSKGSVTPSIRTAPATPAASPQVGGWVGHGHAAHTPATAVQGAAWVQRSYSGRATPVAPVSRHLSAGQSAVPVMPQFGRPSVVAVTAPLVAVASSAMPASHGTMAQAPTTQLPFSCQPMSSPNAAMQPRRHRFSAPAQATQVKRDPRLSQSSSVAPHAVQVPVQVPQPLPLPSGLTGPRAQFDL